MPFASSAKADKWAWVTDWVHAGGVATAFCLSGYRLAEGFAPNFAASVYRLLLEELSGSLLCEKLRLSPKTFPVLFSKYIESVASVFPDRWVKTLTELSSRPVGRSSLGEEFTVSLSDVQQIVRRDLAFPDLGRELPHTR